MSKSGGVRRGVISAHNAVINMRDSHKHMHTHTVSLGVAIGPFPADIALSSVNNTDDNNITCYLLPSSATVKLRVLQC